MRLFAYFSLQPNFDLSNRQYLHVCVQRLCERRRRNIPNRWHRAGANKLFINVKAVPPEYSSDTAFNIMCLFSSRKQSVDKLTCKPRGTVSSFERKALGKEVELILRNINALLLCKTVHDMQIGLLIRL